MRVFQQCRCLYEIENGLTRTKHCFAPCEAQLQILREREEQKKARTTPPPTNEEKHRNNG